jgi:hypothetical protein
VNIHDRVLGTETRIVKNVNIHGTPTNRRRRATERRCRSLALGYPGPIAGSSRLTCSAGLSDRTNVEGHPP